MNIGMRVAGHEGKDTKMLLGHGTLEFLRIMHLEDGTMNGYLNRSIPNIVVTDFQNEEMDKLDPMTLIRAFPAQCAKLRQRGMATEY